MLKPNRISFAGFSGACALAFTMACHSLPAIAQEDFSLWNDGKNYQQFIDIVKEHQAEIKNKLGRFPLFHSEIIDFFETHHDTDLRDRFFSIYGRIQMSTNCYAFAVNDPYGHKPGQSPSPGIAAGIISVDSGNGDIVATMAEQDGLIRAKTHTEKKEGYYRVALVIAEGKDFHWYREHNDGAWYHKIGHQQVSNKDASGQVILSPITADRDYSAQGLNNYSTFYGFFHVPLGGIDLNTPASEKATLRLIP